ncbi:MAG: c-type cytochrome [Flavobacteriales bacterium]
MGLLSKLKGSISISISLFSILIFFSGSISAQDGEKLFKGNCASCHKIDKRLIGPALAGVEDRWESQENLYSWIKNSQDYLKKNSDDSYASDLFAEYKTVMTAMPLSDLEIASVLEYVKNPPVKEGEVAEVIAAPAQGNDYTVYWLIGLLVIVIIIIKVLLDVKSSLRQVKGGVTGEVVKEVGVLSQLTTWLGSHKRTTVGIILFLVICGTVNAWFGAKKIGVYAGYAPTQPIKFSHKIHAGENEIDCGYCHGSAYKGKSAGIPSVNVCMNCHKGISEGKVWGTEEISKIYAAAGFDPETQAYTKEPKPIEWVRIHNLPDFAYFNHSQHVVVGKQKCQTCHGEVETFDYPMKQHSDLTMGWCIDCHRETKVAMKGNAYYDKIHEELKEKYKDKPIKDFTVEHIGGLECAKCHY